MTQENWNKLTFFEQLSNIDGDVERLIRANKRYKSGASDVNQGYFYLDNIRKLVKMTLMDDKNAAKGYRAVELYDEVEELRLYLEGEYSDQYVRDYWNQYTRAIS